MLEPRGAVHIAAPIEEVFDFLADTRHEADWLPGAAGIDLTSAGPIGLGSSFTGTYARAGTVHIVLSDFDRPHALTFRGETKAMSFDDAIQPTAITDGTEPHAVMHTQPTGVCSGSPPR